MLRADVDDPGAEDLGDLLDLRAAAVLGADLHQHQVALDVILAGDVEDLDDRDDLFELLANLVEDAVVAVDDERDAGESRILGRADGQAVDVEGPGGQHPGNMGQDAGLVHHQRGKDVSHAKLTFCSRLGGSISLEQPPSVHNHFVPRCLRGMHSMRQAAILLRQHELVSPRLCPGSARPGRADRGRAADRRPRLPRGRAPSFDGPGTGLSGDVAAPQFFGGQRDPLFLSRSFPSW